MQEERLSGVFNERKKGSGVFSDDADPKRLLPLWFYQVQASAWQENQRLLNPVAVPLNEQTYDLAWVIATTGAQRDLLAFM